MTDLPNLPLSELPKTQLAPLLALFLDVAAARAAVETMLQAGFYGEQIGFLRADDSVLSAANDLATYRATGLAQSAGEDAAAVREHERELAMLREHAVIVTVAPNLGQTANAREMLTSLGGRLLREDGSLEREAA